MTFLVRCCWRPEIRKGDRNVLIVSAMFPTLSKHNLSHFEVLSDKLIYQTFFTALNYAKELNRRNSVSGGFL